MKSLVEGAVFFTYRVSRFLGMYPLERIVFSYMPQYKVVTNLLRNRLRTPSDSEKPVIIFSSCKGKQHPGDHRYNGGVKLYNVWAKLLREHGYESHIVTYTGSRLDWLIEPQSYVSLNDLRKLIKENRALRFITTWLDSTDYLELVQEFYFFDAEIAYTNSIHRSLLQNYLDKSKIVKIATHSRTQQNWYLSRHNIKPALIREWSDTRYWKSTPTRRIVNRVGYMLEDESTIVQVDEIKKICTEANLDLEFVELSGHEREVLNGMQKCDVYLGMNLGKDPVWGEGCPRSQQEAMHAGCILIAYDVEGNHEYLVNEHTGFLIQKDRSDLMATQLIALLKNRRLKNMVRKNSLDYVNEVMSPTESRWKDIARFLDLEVLPPSGIFTTKQELETVLQDPVFLTSPEIRLLGKYANSRDINTIVEIGAAYGSSALTMLCAMQASTSLYSVDPFVRDSMGNFQATKFRCWYNVLMALISLGIQNRAGRWIIKKDFSYDLAPKWNKAIDLLFIDGDHRYREVKRDFFDWSRHVFRGGHIIIHDSRMTKKMPRKRGSRGWPGPTRLAYELNGHRCVKYKEAAFSMTVWEKVADSCHKCDKTRKNG